jgi:hypothetical protein
MIHGVDEASKQFMRIHTVHFPFRNLDRSFLRFVGFNECFAEGLEMLLSFFFFFILDVESNDAVAVDDDEFLLSNEPESFVSSVSE